MIELLFESKIFERPKQKIRGKILSILDGEKELFQKKLLFQQISHENLKNKNKRKKKKLQKCIYFCLLIIMLVQRQNRDENSIK